MTVKEILGIIGDTEMDFYKGELNLENVNPFEEIRIRIERCVKNEIERHSQGLC